MARMKSANSGTKNNKTQITTIPSNQSEYEYKRDRAQSMTFAKMQEIL